MMLIGPQILSTSGESGFFEGSNGETTFTDLHAFLESDPNAVPIDSRDQQVTFRIRKFMITLPSTDCRVLG